MNRRTVLAGALAAMGGRVAAQPVRAGTPPRIGILSVRAPDWSLALNAALLDGLRELGYVDGRNVVIDYPDAQGREDRLPGIAADLVRKGVDVIVVIGPAPLPAAREATTIIPIVMVAGSADPVREGIAASLARPGGNVTGLTYAEPDRFKKQLELLKAMVRRVARVCVLWDFDTATYARDWQAPLSDAARILGIALQEPIHVAKADDLPHAFATMRQRRIDAFLVAAGSFLLPARAQVAELALEAKLPGIAAFRLFPEAGLLMSYGPDLGDIQRRAAGYIDRILKGTKPGDLAIQLPSKFDLAINLRTAQALALTVDPSLQLRATDLYR